MKVLFLSLIWSHFAFASANYPSVIFPQALVTIDNVCVADFGATLKTIKPVTYCAEWVVVSKEICNTLGESQYCREVSIEETAGVNESERFNYQCKTEKSEKLSTPISYQHKYCDAFAPEASDQAGICLNWKTRWQTWPYKYSYNTTPKPNDISQWYGHVAFMKLPKCQ